MVGGPGAQVDASDLPGHEAALVGVVGEPVAGQARLLGESDARPARVAQAPDMSVASRAASTSWPMASVIEKCSMSRSSAKSKVSPPTLPAGSSQPASVNWPASQVYDARQQAVLDLGGERQGNRALAPLEEVGEPAVGDDDVRQGVRGERDLGQHLFVRRLAEQELEHADGFPAVGHRREHAGAVRAVFDARPPARRARARASCPDQRHPLGGLVTLRARGCAAAGVAEPDERVAAEVGDEERHLARVQLARKPLAEDVGSGERRSVLDGREQRREIQPCGCMVLHARSVRHAPTRAREG